jgi:hypothetical protein
MADFVQIPSEEIRDLLPIIIENEIPLRRKKSDGTFSFIPAKDFDAYLKSKHVEFYIDPEGLKKARHDHKKRNELEEQESIVAVKEAPPEVEVPQPDKVFEQHLEMAREMDLGERIQALMNNNYKLKSHSETIEHFDDIAMALAGEVFSSSLMMNKATFEDNLADSQPPDGMKHLVDQTYSLIENLLLMLSRGKATFKDLARLKSIDTGSTTLDHMNRMLIRMVSFLFFYNTYFQKYSTEVQKFRAYFRQKYLPYYDQIVKSSQNTSLEVVFRGGIGPINKKSFIEYSMSGLMHDIGKLPEIFYHDGGEGYDVRKASRHVFDGYNMLLQSKQFTWGTVGACLLHHDYYNAPYGYRQLDTFKLKFPERRTQDRSGTSTTYLMSYNINDVGYGAALGYFPAKVLELIDVFDSMTDERKKYRRSAFSPEEAVQAMRNDFLDGSYPGVDPILYNIFIDFLNVSGIISSGSGISRESLKI